MSARAFSLRIVVAVVLVVTAAEVAVRVAGDQLPGGSGWPTTEYGTKASHLEGLARRRGAGVVAFGSSIIDVGLDPSRLSAAATRSRGGYNAAILGTSPSVMFRWANLVVLPATNPHTVLIAVSTRDLNANGVATRGLDRTFLEAPEIRHLRGEESWTDRVERWLRHRSALIDHREQLRRPLQSYGLWKPDAFALELTKQGFDRELESNVYRNDEKLRAYYRSNLLRDYRLSVAQLGVLADFVGVIRGRGIRVVLVDVPVTELYVALHPRADVDVAEYTEAITQLAQRTGAELLTFGVWPDQYFADPLHVNGAGARRMTDEIDRYLVTAQPPRPT